MRQRKNKTGQRQANGAGQDVSLHCKARRSVRGLSLRGAYHGYGDTALDRRQAESYNL